MSTTTTRLSLLKPAPSEVANYLTALSNNWNTTDAFMQFEGVTSFPGGPVTGKSVYRTDANPKQPYVYNGTSWLPLGVRNIHPESSHVILSGTTTSTSYTQTLTGSSICSTTIRCNVSGTIWVTVEGEFDNSAANDTYLSYEIRENDSSGTVIVAASDRNAQIVQGTTNGCLMFRRSHTGLTPGQNYFVRCMHRTLGGTASYYHRKLILEPN